MRLRAAALACIFTVSVAVAGLPMMASAASVGTDVVEIQFIRRVGRALEAHDSAGSDH